VHCQEHERHEEAGEEAADGRHTILHKVVDERLPEADLGRLDDGVVHRMDALGVDDRRAARSGVNDDYLLDGQEGAHGSADESQDLIHNKGSIPLGRLATTHIPSIERALTAWALFAALLC